MNTVPIRTIQSAEPHLPRAVAAGTLRILATTDLHMHLTAHNFVTDKPVPTPGLAGIATLIEQARAEATEQQIGCLLFDNGDLLQGTPMGDWLALRPVSDDHPAIACLNRLRYDAIGVGNHDLDYGMPYLKQVAARLTPPMIASNLSTTDLSPVTPAALIPCTLPASGKSSATVLKIGVLSVLPQQTALWNHHRLKGIAKVESAAQSLRDALPVLRAQGADLIVVLAHMGLEKNTEGEDIAVPLAQIPGIDAMIMGHTHRRFPGHDHASTGSVNGVESTIAEVPAVMPGHAGSDLAVLDLNVKQDTCGKWRVIRHHSELRSNTANTHPAALVVAATTPVQRELRSHLAVVQAQSPVDLHNYFTLAAPTNIAALTAFAKTKIAQIGLKDLPEADLPLLASSSAHSAGGRDGPENFLHIPKGPVLRRHIWGLNPYSNQTWVVRITGAEVIQRLEHAATVFNQFTAGGPAHPLRNPLRPVFDFDTIFGVRYEIDLVQPPGNRIAKVTYQGNPLAPDQQFLLVTNQFRVAGGGGYAPLGDDRVVLRSPLSLKDGFGMALNDPEGADRHSSPWSITPSQPISATLETAPAALQYLDELAHVSPQVGATSAKGFVQIRLTF